MKHRARPRKALKRFSKLLIGLPQIGSKAFSPLQSFSQYLLTIGKYFQTRAKQDPRTILWMILTTTLLIICIFGTILPSTQTFEGNLTLRHISFTSCIQQPFLKNIRHITELSGKGALPLPLTGQFDGLLSSQTKLDLKPIDSQATWQIIVPPTAQLEVKTLTLSPDVKISHLSYDSFNQRLTFSITPKSASNSQTAILTLNPSGTLKLVIQGYKSVQNLTITDSLEFTWNPNNQITLPIQEPIQLDLKLSHPNNDLFWGELEVQKVKLKELSVADETYDEHYKASALLGGTIRLADKSYTLESGQFLTFQPADSIRTLLHLRLNTDTAANLKTNNNKTVQLGEPSQGINVDISGETQTIRIGLNEKLAIAKIQASFLEGFMSKEAFIALTTFLTTLLLALIAKFLGV